MVYKAVKPRKSFNGEFVLRVQHTVKYVNYGELEHQNQLLKQKNHTIAFLSGVCQYAGKLTQFFDWLKYC